MEGRIYKRDKRSPIPKNATVSKIMSSIKGSNTKPELLLRKTLFKIGMRGYRINYKVLPGKPDIVFTKRKLAIFINGCYWHGCEKCGWKPPKNNTDYWVNKITRNRERDIVNKGKLEELGYTVLNIWEHELKKDIEELVHLIRATLK